MSTITSSQREVNVSGLVNLLKNHNPPKNGKDFAFDLSELIDNSIDAEASDIVIKVKEGSISVWDNGSGMSPKSLSRALDIGFSSKKNQIGRYGIGFKNTTMRLGSKLIVETCSNVNGTNILSRCSGLAYSADKPDIRSKVSDKAPFTHISLELNPGLLKSRWLQHITQTLTMIYSPILETGKVRITLNGKSLLPDRILQDPVFSASFRDIEVNAYFSDDFLGKESYLYKGTSVVFGDKRSLVIGSNYLLHNLSEGRVNYEDLRVVININSNSTELSASTSKNGFVIEDHKKEYEEFLDDCSETIQELYLEHKARKEKEIEDKKTQEALKEISKHLNQAIKELQEDLELFQEGSSYRLRSPVVNPAPAKKPPVNESERKERNDKGQSRKVRLEIIERAYGANSRTHYIEREAGTNLFKIMVNTNHDFFKVLVQGKDKIDMSTFKLSLAPMVLSEVVLSDSGAVDLDHYQDTVSFMHKRVANMKS